ncbi:UBP18 [Symbiodinium natans]|uniref:UBP18 protein n=1 Tax=Symbiodinium natans TaxID=878477 RepID=A0A812R7A9_9DINO|nr:UBP18 [Symbiodinium natans]
MAVPSLDDLLAELDRQEEQEAESTVQNEPTRSKPSESCAEEAVTTGYVEGGSAPSAKRRGGRFTQMVGTSTSDTSQSSKMESAAQSGTVTSASIAQRYGRPLSCGHDCDASTHDDDRSPHTSLTATSGQAAQEPETLPRFSELLSQLDVDVMDTDRQKAQAEAAAFEERQRQAKHEAAQKAVQDEIRRVEAVREAWERHRMAAEESEERRRRANRHAIALEEKTRRMVQKQTSKRMMQKEEEQRLYRQEKERRKEERLRSEAAKMSEKIRRMAESGYALGPSGWVRLDWLSNGQADVGMPNFEVVKGPTEEEESESEEGSADDADPGDPFEVVDQRPVPEEEQLQPEPVSLDDVLADIDRKQREGWASGAEPGDLNTVLGVLAADEEREKAETAAIQVRQNYEELGEVENLEEELPPDATQSAAKVLHVAKSRRPDGNFSDAINSESALKPFNDFVEEKQEGVNSYEERQARSAAIQAKLQAARNRLSLVRYER